MLPLAVWLITFRCAKVPWREIKLYYWKSTNSSALRKQRPRVSLLWIFNFKKSSKQWTEFIRFRVRSFFLISSNLKIMLLLFHVLKITRLGKKINATYKISEYKYTNFRSPCPQLYILSNPQLQKTWQVISNTTFCMIF